MNYIKFRLQYKKDSNSIVPDIRNKLFEQDKISHKISAVQIHRIAAVSICFVIVLSAVFVGVYSDRTNSYNNNSGLPSSQNRKANP
jgi:predicted anti-sigma-YlaC factor YlaD